MEIETAKEAEKVEESGTGVPPVPEIKKRHGAYLPHWTRDGGWHAVTFRIWDSLPQHMFQTWLFERKNIVKSAEQMKRPLSEHEERRLAHLYSEKVERYLDNGYGSCFMKDERVADQVRDALLHFNDVRYSLAAWCVMPNHVHVVVQPLGENTGGTPVPHSGCPRYFTHGNHSPQRRPTSYCIAQESSGRQSLMTI